MVQLLINVIRILAPIAGVVCFFLDLPIVVYIAGGVDAVIVAFEFIISRKASGIFWGVFLFGLPLIVTLIFDTPWILWLCFTVCFLNTAIMAFTLLCILIGAIVKRITADKD